jgi:hypothetical protein
MSNPTHSNRGAAGAGLLLVLLALLIMLVLYFSNFGGGSYMKSLGTARHQAKDLVQEINTQQLSILISTYRQTNNKLPKTAEDLESPGAFRDPWGRDMTFVFETNGDNTKVIYHSLGPDGQPDTEDDIRKPEQLPF